MRSGYDGAPAHERKKLKLGRYSNRVRSALIALALGALLALCGLPYPWSALSPLPLAAVFAYAAWPLRPGVGAARLFWAGLAFFTATLYWLPASFGAGFGPFGALMFLPLYALEAGFWAALGWLCFRAAGRPLPRVWLLACGWVLLEWLRHLGQVGFPWGTLGYTLLPTPAAQIADLGGVLSLSLLVALTAAALVSAAGGAWRPLLWLAALWGGALTYGLTRPDFAGQPGRALLLRTDFNSFDKASGLGGGAQLAEMQRLSRAARPGELLIWSETAIDGRPFPFSDQRALLPGRPMLLGIQLPERNSAVAWNGQAVLGGYDKMQLVPFGEYYPFKDRLRGLYDFIYAKLGFAFDPPTPGEFATPLPLLGHLYGTYICYDSVFGRVAGQLVAHGAEVLVNVSNDGWYNDSVGVEQHFQMGRLRAIETRRYLLRSVNRGVAAVVDPRGAVLQRFSGPGPGVLHARFAYRQGLTPYVRLGDAPTLGLVLLGVLWALVAARRRQYDL